MQGCFENVRIHVSHLAKSGDFAFQTHLPPPAQAQAQPAHAQAHAHDRPPPPPGRPPRELPAAGFGRGLVTFVTRLVKSVTLPMTFWENVCVPSATAAAKSEPGKRGTEGMDPDDGEEPVDAEPGLENVGSYRGHHIGTKTGPLRTRRVRSS